MYTGQAISNRMRRDYGFTEENEITRPILEDNRLRQTRVSQTTTRILVALWVSTISV